MRAATSATFASLPGIDAVEIRMDVANVASTGVARSAGYAFDREIDSDIVAPGRGGRDLVWRMTRDAWASTRR